ncbi:MAG: hypothetical protein MUE85_15295 [Microscillaceae bacterium]|nr:hypothetical protein [Microscillaceae bacterium]
MIWTHVDAQLQIDYLWYHKPKCQGESSNSGYTYELTSEITYRPYQSSRALNRYWHRVKFYNYTAQIETRVFEIKWGY